MVIETKMLIDKKQDGFSLLEVAIAMATIAILSFGVMFGFTITASQDRDAYELSRSQAQCQELIEQAESFSYDDLFAIAGNPMVFTRDNLTCTINVTQIQSDLLAIVTSVETTIQGTYQVTLSTLKTQKQESL
ncbi:MAG: type II secretory pathway pseudopilin PulG [Planctomycetota bacterium]|jgi:type II secretory pathway pseudopilin PulG